MRNGLLIAATVCAAAVSVHGQEVRTFTFAPGMRVPLESKPLKGAPYSADVIVESVQALADGNRIVHRSTGRVYRDSEGRVRREEENASGETTVSISDPVSGVSYALDPKNRVAWKTPGGAADAIVRKLSTARMLEELKVRQVPEGAAQVTVTERSAGDADAKVRDAKEMAAGVAFQVNGGRVELRKAAREERSDEVLASRVVEGIRVDGHRTTTTIAAGAIGNEWPIVSVSEEWTSPELQVLVLTERSDPRDGNSTYRLVNVVRSEPPALLFQVPQDYTVKETGIKRFEFSRQQ